MAPSTRSRPAGATAPPAPPAAKPIYRNLRMVGKAFNGAGVDRVQGEVVDIQGPAWRNAATLETMRHLQQVPQNIETVICSCGREFVDEAARARHEALQHAKPIAAKKKRVRQTARVGG